jgi:hypothetical protein
VGGDGVMWPTHMRLGELWFLKTKGRGLTEEEETELRHCLQANMEKCTKLARLYNLSHIAYATNDTEYLHSLCAEIDQIKDELYDYM